MKMTLMPQIFHKILVFLSLLAATLAHAQLSIEITGAGANRIPVAIANFAGDPAAAQVVTATIRADLERSGLFKLVDPGGAPLDENSPVNFGDWKGRGADALAAGSLARGANGRMEARFRLYDTQKQAALGGAVYVTGNDQLRAAGHRIADYIYEKLTGDKGVFSTRIAYVTKSGKVFKLWVSDADGENAQAALTSGEPIISPAWSPDGSQLAYVSFESRKPVVYVHSVSTGKRRLIANFRGSNSAPAWSPDSKTLAVTLSRDGGSQLFLLSSQGGEPRRLTQSSSIDTEPVFSPDGRMIYFVSDRGGSPQVYRMSVAGQGIERVTFTGSYNISPALSADGRWMAYISRVGGVFKLQLMELATGSQRELTNTTADESPSFAPNSKLLMYATQQQGREALMTTTLDGKVKATLSGQAGEIREPDWGPFFRP